MIKHISPIRVVDWIYGVDSVVVYELNSNSTTRVDLSKVWSGSEHLAVPGSLVDRFMVICLLKITKAKTVFEFGTFMGEMTFNIVHNLPSDGHVWTLDLDTADDAVLRGDKELAEKSLSGRVNIQNDNKISKLYANSRDFDFSPYEGGMDMVYIDGGHDRETVLSDTENAIKMLRNGGCIIWHDYWNWRYPEVTKVLDAMPNDMIHIGDTQIVFGWGSWA